MSRRSYAVRRTGRQVRRTVTRKGENSEPAFGSNSVGNVIGTLTCLIFAIPAILLGLALLLYLFGD